MSNPKYRVSLRLGNNVQTKIAPSIVEALNKMEPQYFSKAKAIISVSVGKLKAQVMLFPIYTRRLFINKTAKEVFQKRMIGALK
jgi:hypothetical protein